MCNRNKKIRIYTDSKFLINCMTQWISKWKNNNWITSAKEPVKNKDSLQELDSVLSLMECIDWVNNYNFIIFFLFVHMIDFTKITHCLKFKYFIRNI